MTKENWLVKIKPGKENGEQGEIRFKGFEAMYDLFKNRRGVNRFFKFESDERIDAEEGAELLGQIRRGNRPSDCKLEDISPEQWEALCDKEIATLKFS